METEQSSSFGSSRSPLTVCTLRGDPGAASVQIASTGTLAFQLLIGFHQRGEAERAEGGRRMRVRLDVRLRFFFPSRLAVWLPWAGCFPELRFQPPSGILSTQPSLSLDSTSCSLLPFLQDQGLKLSPSLMSFFCFP